MGTPEFARAVLVHLCTSPHEVAAVVTGRDKPVGRRQVLTPTPVRQAAEERGLPVLMPGSLKSPELHERLRAFNADLFVVAAFRILPTTLYKLPRYGAINIHTSLLPRYRGAAPIHWAIINGETETGLTSFYLNETIDTGDMILQERTVITPQDTYDTLHDRLAAMAGPFCVKTLALIEAGQRQAIPQADNLATRAPKIEPFDALIDFGMPADRVRDFVRGMATKPGAYTFFRRAKTKIHACTEADLEVPLGTRPGTVLADRKRLLVACGCRNGRPEAVELLRLVPAGKKEMDGRSFMNGFRPKPGEVFGDLEGGVATNP
jgi:methionyl-tRNA formyltransferase